jgi:hypothetical protein
VDANAAAVPDVDVNAPGTAVRVVVLRTREDVVAARAARLVMSAAAQPHDGVDTAGG